MKRSVLLVLSSLFLIGNVAFAKQSLPLDLAFNPVPWYPSVVNGGFHMFNQTNKTQYVQVAISTGEIYVYTYGSNGLGNCGGNLNAEFGPFSIVCEVAPHEELSGDIDFAKMMDASGTYQVEMSH